MAGTARYSHKRKSEVSRTDSGSRLNGTAFKPEIVKLLVAHLECTEEHACDLIERAVYGGSLEDIKSGSSPAQVRVEAGHAVRRPSQPGGGPILRRLLRFIRGGLPPLAVAQSNLGHMYRKGQGVPQDYALAAKWYGRAAERRRASDRTVRALLHHRP